MEDKELSKKEKINKDTLQEEDILDIEKRIQALEERIESMKKEETPVEESKPESEKKEQEDADLLEIEETPKANKAEDNNTTETNEPEQDLLSPEEASLIITKEMMNALNDVPESEGEQEKEAAEESDVAEEVVETVEEESETSEEAEATEENNEEEVEETAEETTDNTAEETSIEDTIEKSIEEEQIEVNTEDNTNDITEEIAEEEFSEEAYEETEENIEIERSFEEDTTEPEDLNDLKTQIEEKLRDVEKQSDLLLEYLAAKMADTRDNAAMVYDNVKHDMKNDVDDMRIRNGLSIDESKQEDNEAAEDETVVSTEDTVENTTPDVDDQNQDQSVSEETAEDETVAETAPEETTESEITTDVAEEAETEITESENTDETAGEETVTEEKPAEEKNVPTETETETAPEDQGQEEVVTEEKSAEPETKQEGIEETVPETPEEKNEAAPEKETEQPEEKQPEEKKQDEEETIKEPEKTGFLSNRQYMWIALLAVLVALGVCVHSMYPAMQKNRRYQDALKQMERGEYAEAYESLDGLSGYKDADRYITYCNALEYYNSGELDQAIDAFTRVSDLGEAQQYIDYITAEKTISDSTASKDFVKAAELFNQAGGLLDSKAMAEYCQGITAFLNNESNAKDLLKKIADKKEVKETYYNNAADLVRYIDAGTAFDNDDLSSYDTLRELASKEEAFVSRMAGRYTEYVKGLDYLEKEKYFSAYSCFSNCQGLKDADELAQSCFQTRPVSGILYRNVSSGSVEITVYDTSDSKDMYLKIYDEKNELIETLYVRDGESATAYFQGGTFRMAVAYGENGWWFGPEESFGSTGIYQRLILSGSDEYYNFPSGASYSLRFDVDDGNVNRRSSDYGDF
ncbi:MAG: hypothetical protein IJL85_03605 [Erysipelotrichaceae bacterium]|nr:hypothetical protein [Erysipelotrichaceae bacterium]